MFGIETELVVAAVSGLGALGFGTWKYVEHRRDFLNKEALRRPFARGSFRQTSEQEWGDLAVIFYSPGGLSFAIEQIEVLSPRRGRLRREDKFGRKLAVNWRIPAGTGLDAPASQVHLSCDAPPKAHRLKLRAKGREISALGRRVVLFGHATRYDGPSRSREQLVREALKQF